MQKRNNLIGVIVIFSFLLSAFSALRVDTSPGFEVNFDSPDDLDNLEIWQSDNGKVNPAHVIKDGVLHISKDLHMRGARVGDSFGFGDIIHARVRVSEGACFPVELMQDPLFEGDDGKVIQFGGCANNVLGTMLIRNMADNTQKFGKVKLNGSVRVNPDEWMDFIFWLDPNGKKVIVIAGNESEVTYGSLPSSDSWPIKELHLAMEIWAGPPDYLEVDFMRQVKGTIEDYLAENLMAYEKNKDNLVAFLKAAPPEFPKFGDHPPVSIDPNMEAMGIVGSWLENQRDVWAEGPEAWKENNGGHFGSGSIKNYDDAAKSLVFKNSGKENISTPLNTPLDEYNEDEDKGNQGILFRFKAKPASPLYFTLQTPGQNEPLEFCVDFWKKSKPYITMVAESKTDPFADSTFTVENEKWYYMLMAIDKNGYFVSVIWEDGNPDNMITFMDDLSAHPDGDKYKNASWKFIIGANKANTLYISEYKVLTFDSVINK